MSMRATFTTDFIYDGVDGYLERKANICNILGVEMDLKGGSMIGQVAGITKGLDLAESDVRRYIEEMSAELYHSSRVDFNIVWLLEGGDIIVKKIHGKKEEL